MSLQNIAHRLIGKLVAKVRHGPHDPVVSPTWIIPGHAHDQMLDFLIDRRTAHCLAKFRSIELLGDQPPVPSKKRIRRSCCSHLFQGFASQPVGNFRQSSFFRVGKQQSALDFGAKNTVLSYQIFISQ